MMQAIGSSSTCCNLACDESGFSNLYLAGDWLKTIIDFGYIERAVMGGMQAAPAR